VRSHDLLLLISTDKTYVRLLYRAWQVCQTPNEILVDKLGLDIPPSPEVTLEEISAREIHIAWKHPDFHHSVSKHIIQVNSAKGADLYGNIHAQSGLTVFQWARPNERKLQLQLET
jgi:hypothetical protein